MRPQYPHMRHMRGNSVYNIHMAWFTVLRTFTLRTLPRPTLPPLTPLPSLPSLPLPRPTPHILTLAPLPHRNPD